MMSDAEEVGILIHRAHQLGFTFVDLYVIEDEVIAFTCSKSMDYVETLQDIKVQSSTPKEAEV